MSDWQVMNRPRTIGGHRNVSSRRNTPHKLIYRRWLHDLWAGRCQATDLVSEDFVGHWPNRDVHGPAELQAMVDRTRGTFKELQFLLDVGPFEEGDLIAARWIGTGSGAGGPRRFTGNDVMRISGGRIVEYWNGTARG
ncbi:ester cyclase [Mycolicibacterium vaccae]|uniref:ester cyclase n=1 Tax=Mycolicibacterium vaccae TaxID=1810 RepID=UPI003D0894B8